MSLVWESHKQTGNLSKSSLKSCGIATPYCGMARNDRLFDTLSGAVFLHRSDCRRTCKIFTPQENLFRYACVTKRRRGDSKGGATRPPPLAEKGRGASGILLWCDCHWQSIYHDSLRGAPRSAKSKPASSGVAFAGHRNRQNFSFGRLLLVLFLSDNKKSTKDCSFIPSVKNQRFLPAPLDKNKGSQGRLRRRVRPLSTRKQVQKFCTCFCIYLPAMLRPWTSTLGEPKLDMPGISRLEATAWMFFSSS